MPPDSNTNGNISTKIDVAKLQESFRWVGEELKELNRKVELIREEASKTKSELKDDIADIRSDIKLLYFKVGLFSAGSGTVAAGIITIIAKLVG